MSISSISGGIASETLAKQLCRGCSLVWNSWSDISRLHAAAASAKHRTSNRTNVPLGKAPSTPSVIAWTRPISAFAEKQTSPFPAPVKRLNWHVLLEGVFAFRAPPAARIAYRAAFYPRPKSAPRFGAQHEIAGIG